MLIFYTTNTHDFLSVVWTSFCFIHHHVMALSCSGSRWIRSVFRERGPDDTLVHSHVFMCSYAQCLIFSAGCKLVYSIFLLDKWMNEWINRHVQNTCVWGKGWVWSRKAWRLSASYKTLPVTRPTAGKKRRKNIQTALRCVFSFQFNFLKKILEGNTFQGS